MIFPHQMHKLFACLLLIMAATLAPAGALVGNKSRVPGSRDGWYPGSSIRTTKMDTIPIGTREIITATERLEAVTSPYRPLREWRDNKRE